MSDEVLKKLLECGVHFGHQTRRWNPKMKKFIFGERNGIYIVDLEKTVDLLNIACDYVHTVTMGGGSVFFVGTKKQAKEVIESEAKRAQMPYVSNRWMGGLLTNFQTVKKSLGKLLRIEKMAEDGVMENLKKKEVAQLNKEKEKLLRDLGGIRDMKDLPKAIFVVDPKREDIAVKEATRLNIPVVALIDTNCDPDFIDYPVPGNDDALKSVRYITSRIADSAIEGRKEYVEAQTVQKKKEEATEAQAKKEQDASVMAPQNTTEDSAESEEDKSQV